MPDPSIPPLAAHARSPLPLGHSVGGKRILAVLSAGRFGIAYLAAAADPQGEQRHVVLREYMPAGIATRRSDSYAVRALRASDRADFDWGLTRLRQECEALAALEHPSLARVLGFVEAHGTGYIVEQYVEGQSLAAVLERRGRLPEAEIRYLLSPLLDALEEAHRVGLVHGGIEPGDIVFGPEGVPILVGFGAPRPAPAQDAANGAPGAWNPYAPHEIYNSGASVGPWTDLYGLGAVLYRAVTGAVPPAGPARVAALDRGEADPLRPLVQLAGYSAGLVAAIDGALAPSERERPQSLAAFRALLSTAPPSRNAGGQGTRADAAKPDQPPLFDLESARPRPPSGTREGGDGPAGGARRRAPLPDTPPPLLAPAPGAAAKAGAARRPQRAWMWGAAFAFVVIAGVLGWRQFDPQMNSTSSSLREPRRNEQSATALRIAEERRRADETQRAEAARQAEEAHKAEEARRADARRKAEEARKAEAARKAEHARRDEEERRAAEARKVEEARKAEEARRAELALREVRVSEAIAAVRAAIERKEWAAARGALVEAESLAPRHPKLAELRGRLVAEVAARVARADEAAARREWSAAEKLLDEASAILPDSPTLAAGRERVAASRRTWEDSLLALERKADLLIGEAAAAARGFDFAAAAEKLGEAEQALEGFPKDHPLRLKLLETVAAVQRAIDDVDYERQRARDADAYLVNRARADLLFELAQKELHEKKNPQRACVLYRESADFGHVGAQNQLGLCFATGNGMPKDEVEAYNWFRRAAEGGNAVGQFNLAHAFAVGAGIAKHLPSAVEWARKSADQGYAKGTCRLGIFHRDGEGLPANPAEAARLFRRGADRGDEWCMALLAEAYEKGTGVAADPKQARLWWERSAAKGYEPAKARLKSMR